MAWQYLRLHRRTTVATHELKTDPVPFDAVARGEKTFEVRLNDRDFQPGDELLLRRTRNSGWAMRNTGAPLEYTGEQLRCVVGYVLEGPGYGIADGWVVLSLTHVSGVEGRPVTAQEDRWLRDAAKRSSTLVAPGKLVSGVTLPLAPSCKQAAGCPDPAWCARAGSCLNVPAKSGVDAAQPQQPEEPRP
jgi:hypothetical protein